jgi:hypothetical protein
MTIEEKAKAYDEALARAKKLCEYPTTQPFVSTLEEIFPELAESEDEKIRKAIVNAIHNYAYRLEEKIPTEWLVWLEKQKEHYDFRQSIQVGDHVTKNDTGVLVNLSQLERVAKPAEQELSEDEKIRKELKHYLEVKRCITQSDEEYVKCNTFLAWLEKQGERRK